MAIRDLIPWGRQESRAPERTDDRSDQQHPLVSLHRDVNRLFDDVFRGFGVPQAAIAHEVAKAGGGVEAWFIHGNHDVDQETFAKNLFDAEGADRNLHARVVEIAGVRIAGLGGVFEKEIWHPDVRGGDHAWHSYAEYAAGLTRELEWGDAQAARGRLLKHRASIFMDAYETLFDDSADVLVLHEAPACHPRGFSVLDDLAQALGVSRVFHGHHHDNLDYSQFSATAGYTVRGVGYRGIADLQGDGVRKGAYDDDRDNLPGP